MDTLKVGMKYTQEWEVTEARQGTFTAGITTCAISRCAGIETTIPNPPSSTTPATIANPRLNATLQGRHDSYPKRRGMTRVPEMMAAGIDVAFGHDCAMDPWYSLGSGDMLEVAHMGLHVAQMTGQDAMRACFRAVTETPAAILGLEGYGLAPGCHADFVLLQARDPVEAIRLRATRLAVVRRGRVIARSPANTASLQLPGRANSTSFQR